MGYTWGQIRLLISQDAKGVSLDAIDQKINARYAAILGMRDWKGLEGNATLQTMDAYRTGTIAVTQGSTAVVGTGTTWLNGYSGWQLLIGGSRAWYTATVVDGQHITLDRPYESQSDTAASYSLINAIMQLPDDCRHLRVIRSPATGLQMTEMTSLEFAQEVGFAICEGVAQAYIPQPDGVNSSDGDTVKQILLYPLPLWARGYQIVYERLGIGFDGTTTGTGPFDFVSGHAIIAGAKMDLKCYSNALELQGLMNEWDTQISAMHHVENGERKPLPLKLADVYTRHRRQRLYR
jgi:hypothetical protein